MGVIVCRCLGEVGGVGEFSEGVGGVGFCELEEVSVVVVVVVVGGVVGEFLILDDGMGKVSEFEFVCEYFCFREGGGEWGCGCGWRGEGWGCFEWDFRCEVDFFGCRWGIEFDEVSSGWVVGWFE